MNISNHENAFKDVVCNMTAIFPGLNMLPMYSPDNNKVMTAEK